MLFEGPRRSMLAVAAVLAVFMLCSAAVANGFHKERAYADSFGNLVIHSPGGYKRILVGKGHLASTLAGRREHAPAAAYLEEEGGRLYLRKYRPCPHGVLLHGRSYMYGLPDNVVPVLIGACGD